MNLLDKIKNDVNNLTKEELGQIEKDQSLIDALVESIPKNLTDKDFLDRLPEELFKKIFFIEPIFNLFIDMFRSNGEEEFFDFIFSNEGFYTFITPENEEIALKAISGLQEKFYDDYIKRIEDESARIIDISNEKIINHIIKNKLYFRAGAISLEAKLITPEIEDFLIEALKNDSELILSTITPKIKQYCIDNNCIYRIIGSLNYKKPEDIKTVRDAIENGSITYEQFKKSRIYTPFKRLIADSDVLIISELLAGDYLTDEQIEYVATNPVLINKIIEIMSNITENNNIYSYNLLAKKVPEIRIAFIMYNLECLSSWYNERYGSTLKNYYDQDYDMLLNLYNTKKDFFIEAVLYFIDHNVDKTRGIADLLLLDDNFTELRDAVFRKLSNVDYSTLLLNYLNTDNNNNNNNTENEGINRLIEYIDNNNISLVLSDISQLEKIINFDAHIRFLKYITIEQLNSGKYNYLNVIDKFNDSQKKIYLQILIDLVVKNKSTYFNDSINVLVINASEKDIRKMVSIIPELSLSFRDILLLKNVNSANPPSCEELIEKFKDAKKISSSDFSIVSNFVNKDNIAFIKWMLDSPYLDLNDAYLYNELERLRSHFSDEQSSKEYTKIVNDFLIRIGNIPAIHTFHLGKDVIEKATLNCDDDYYTNNVEFFKVKNNNHTSLEYRRLLFKRIMERVLNGKDVAFELFVYCAKDFLIDEYENIEDVIYSPNLLWDNKQASIDFLLGELGTPIYSKYIREHLIPDLKNTDIKDDTDIEGLMDYNPEFFDRIRELIKQGMQFGWQILKLVRYANNPEVLDLLNEIYNNKQVLDFSSLNHNFFKLNHPLIDKCITERIIPDNTLLASWVEVLLANKPYFEQAVADKIQTMEQLSYKFVFKGAENYPIYFNVLLNAFREGKVVFHSFTENYFNPSIILAILENDPNYIDKIITYLIHENSNPSQEIMDVLIPHISQYKGFNADNYKYLYKVYGNTTIHLIEDDNFKYLCNQDRKAIEKLVKLLEPRTLDRLMIEGINNSIRQNIYGDVNHEVTGIYTTIATHIQNGTLLGEIREQYIQLLAPAVPIGLEEKIIATGDEKLLQLYNSDKELFIDYLFDCFKNNQNTFIDTLTAVTNNYIILKRNEFAQQDDIFKDTNISFEYDQKSLMDVIFKELLANDRRLLLKFLDLPTSFLRHTPDEYDFGEEIIDYYTLQFLFGKDLTDKLSKEDLIKVKKNIGVLKTRFVSNVLGRTFPGKKLPTLLLYMLDDPSIESKIKRILILPTRQRNLTLEMSNLNIKTIMENVIADDEKYEALLETIKKFRLLDWGDIFDPGISQLSIASEVDNLYSFLSAFSQIYESEKENIDKYKKPKVLKEALKMREEGASEEEIKKYIEKELKVQFSGFKILKYCSIFSSIPNCYKLLLGKEDFDIIKKNESPNASSRSIIERMNRVYEVYIKALKQQEVSVPSIITDKELSSGRKLRVIVGNRAHPRNMSHGERTGACMRALGHADRDGENDLFEFSATNFNGFHITFVDPDTDEYVSRVSGFRNGNTLFLNQLREVVKENKKYTNQDVIEAMQLAAQELIEISKESTLPIENVVASPSYALYNKPTQALSSHYIGEGVYTGYRDVTGNAVVLATTGENGKAVPLDIGDPSRHPHYRCVRIYPVELRGNLSDKDKIKLQRVTAIKNILEHENEPGYFEGIDIDVLALEEELLYTIIGQDWFVSLNSQLEIKSDIIPLDDRAQLEYEVAMAKVIAVKDAIINGRSRADTVTDGGLKNG